MTKMTQPQLENYVLEQHFRGRDIELISKLLMVNFKVRRGPKAIDKILKMRVQHYSIERFGLGKTFANRIVTRDRYNHTLEK
jgi:hypothetical protein